MLIPKKFRAQKKFGLNQSLKKKTPRKVDFWSPKAFRISQQQKIKLKLIVAIVFCFQQQCWRHIGRGEGVTSGVGPSKALWWQSELEFS